MPYILDRAGRLATARFAVGVEILPYELVAVVTDPIGVMLAWRRWPVPEMDVETVVKRISAAARELVSTSLGYELPDSHVGLGLQIGGPVDAHKRIVLSYCNNPTDAAYREHPYQWERPTPLADLVQEETGCRTVVENDAAAYAVYEQRFGVGRQAKSFAVILVRDGIGGGVVLEEQLAPIPFEVGHIRVSINGRRCDCGNFGCIEAYAGRRAILGIVSELMGGKAVIENIENIVELSKRDDKAEEVLQAFHEGGTMVARGVATVLTMFGVNQVVIFGPPAMIDRIGNPTAQAFLRGLERFPEMTYPIFRDCSLITRALGRTDGAHGAALVALNQFFFVPVSNPEQR
jgi:Transcriptional regulator/sugar kinase